MRVWDESVHRERGVETVRSSCGGNILALVPLNAQAHIPEFKHMKKKTFTLAQAKAIGKQLGVIWDKCDVEQFHAGLLVELEHGTDVQATNVTDDDPLITGKIALAHLAEFPDYYTRLKKMEQEAKRFWKAKNKK